MIAQRLDVSKSTLSYWLGGIPFTPNSEVLKRVHEGQLKSALFKNRQKIESIKRGRELGAKEIGKLNKRDLFMIGVALYIGEGAKLYDSIRIVNADPNVIRIAIRWFREVCGLTTNNFTITLHLYPDVSPAAAIRYWSNTTGVPATQFGKTQIDRRTNKSDKKHRILPYGTAHLAIKSCGNPDHGTELHRRIMGWIEAVYSQSRTRV